MPKAEKTPEQYDREIALALAQRDVHKTPALDDVDAWEELQSGREWFRGARDAMLEQNRTKTQIMDILLPALGDYAGLAFAVLEAEVKALGQKSSGKKSTRLDREIYSFLSRSRRS